MSTTTTPLTIQQLHEALSFILLNKQAHPSDTVTVKGNFETPIATSHTYHCVEVRFNGSRVEIVVE